MGVSIRSGEKISPQKTLTTGMRSLEDFFILLKKKEVRKMEFEKTISYPSDIDKFVEELVEQARRPHFVDSKVTLELHPSLLAIGDEVPYIPLTKLSNFLDDFTVKVAVTTRTVYKHIQGKIYASESIESVVIIVEFFRADAEKHAPRLRELIKAIYDQTEYGKIRVKVRDDPGAFRMKDGAESTALFNPFLP